LGSDAASATAAYNALHPYYVQVCTMTQLVRRTGRFDEAGEEIVRAGGRGGHATVFLKGARIDRESLPGVIQLAVCGEGEGLADPDAGVGISVNQIFANTNWVAIPGRGNFFHGGVDPEAVLTREMVDDAIRGAIDAGWFEGIEIKPDRLARFATDHELSAEELRAPENRRAYQELMVLESLATDFGLTLGRSVVSVRLPMPRRAFEEFVAHLNEVNRTANAEGNPWDLALYNCSHPVSNAFARVGVIGRKTPLRRSAHDWINWGKHAWMLSRSLCQWLMGGVPDVSVPSNMVVRLASESCDREPASAHVVWVDRRQRKLFDEYAWLPSGHGALLEILEMRTGEHNEVFRRGQNPFVWWMVEYKNHKARFGKYQDESANPQLFDLRENLLHKLERYRRVRDGRNRSTFRIVWHPRLRAFHERYHDWIDTQIADAEVKLARLQELGD